MAAARSNTANSTGRRAARRRAGLPLLLVGAAVLVLVVQCRLSGGFAAPPGLTRKQTKANIHTRGQLPPVLEVPLEEPEEEAPPKEPLPERRIPYSMHIVSHFPNNKHLHEESQARKFIEKKIVDSFENYEDIIRHIEVNLQVSENFHREKPAHHKLQVDVDEDQMEIADRNPGTRELAPYIFKVTVSLQNHRTVVLANAEKHAQPTLTEGLDHMVDVIKKSLREEKDKDIQARKKAKQDSVMKEEGLLESDAEVAEADAIVEEIEAEEDKKMEELYKAVEAKKE